MVSVVQTAGSGAAAGCVSGTGAGSGAGAGAEVGTSGRCSASLSHSERGGLETS